MCIRDRVYALLIIVIIPSQSLCITTVRGKESHSINAFRFSARGEFTQMYTVTKRGIMNIYGSKDSGKATSKQIPTFGKLDRVQ